MPRAAVETAVTLTFLSLAPVTGAVSQHPTGREASPQPEPEQDEIKPTQ